MQRLPDHEAIHARPGTRRASLEPTVNEHLDGSANKSDSEVVPAPVRPRATAFQRGVCRGKFNPDSVLVDEGAQSFRSGVFAGKNRAVLGLPAHAKTSVNRPFAQSVCTRGIGGIQSHCGKLNQWFR